MYGDTFYGRHTAQQDCAPFNHNHLVTQWRLTVLLKYYIAKSISNNGKSNKKNWPIFEN